MSNSATNVDPEDVLSSIRRLVSQRVEPEAPAEPPIEALVLTPSLRVEPEFLRAAAEDAAEKERQAAAAQEDAPAQDDDVAPDAWTQSADTAAGLPFIERKPSEKADLQSRVAELEAALDNTAAEFEPDGSEMQELPTEMPAELTRAARITPIAEQADESAQAEAHAQADASAQTSKAPAEPSTMMFRRSRIEHEDVPEETPAAETGHGESVLSNPAPEVPFVEVEEEAPAKLEKPPREVTLRPGPLVFDREPVLEPAEAPVAPAEPQPEPAAEATRTEAGFDGATLRFRMQMDEAQGALEAQMPETEESGQQAQSFVFNAHPRAPQKDAAAEPVIGVTGDAPLEQAVAAEVEDVVAGMTFVHRGDLAASFDDDDPLAIDESNLALESAFLDDETLRELVNDMIRQELRGQLGERITRTVRKLVRREVHRALAAQDFS